MVLPVIYTELLCNSALAFLLFGGTGRANRYRTCQLGKVLTYENWPPISLLSVIYKMASTAIANRLKPYLNDVISNLKLALLVVDILVKIPILCMIYFATLKKNKS